MDEDTTKSVEEQIDEIPTDKKDCLFCDNYKALGIMCFAVAALFLVIGLDFMFSKKEVTSDGQ